MATHDTPGLLIEEITPLPPPITDVETAVPAFVGYTQKATNTSNGDLLFKPTLVRSMRDFEEFFGDAGATGATVHVTEHASGYTVDRVEEPTTYHPLYFAMRMFFDNGGQRCYVVSVGTRSTSPAVAPDLGNLMTGLDAVGADDAPTLIVVPEAVSLSLTDYATLAAAIIAQCTRRQDRFAIFDLFDGANPRADFKAARDAFPTTPDLRHAAVYYPFVRTTLTYPYVESNGTSNALVSVGKAAPVDVASLVSSSPALYNVAVTAVRNLRVTLPPSGAIAGMYAATDASRGVWKTPANVQLVNVVEPAVALDSRTADALNVDTATGKSINTIRAFAGKGTLVWGARTLAGNDNEWRYIPVRRLFTLVEQSVKTSTRWVVFEPNDANTWTRLRSTLENYLVEKWKQGAILGTKPEEAFFVRCGLGSTMTAQDILEGRLIAEVGMAPVRPAEFIILRFAYRMPTA